MIGNIKNENTLKALARLNNDPDFTAFKAMLQETREKLQAETEVPTDSQILYFKLGGLAMIRDILTKAEEARKHTK